MKVAIIGAGLFGCTTAIHLARNGHQISLFEMMPSIMMAASRTNQQRLHKGYHYPRSPETIMECLEGASLFTQWYGRAVVPYGRQIYALAKHPAQKTSAHDYTAMLRRFGLWYKHIHRIQPPELSPTNIEHAFEVNETFIDYERLKAIVWQNLTLEVGKIFIHPLTNARRAIIKIRQNHDQIILAAYAGNNQLLQEFGCEPIPTQYELVEKPMVQLPKKYRKTGVVVMDGPFGCIDPWGRGGEHVMGHVSLAVHETSDTEAEVLDLFVEGDPESRFEEIRAGIARYVPFAAEAELIDSMWAVRAVMPGVDDTDERPTIVRRHDDKVLSIFSGKLACCVRAALSVERHINAPDS